MGLSKQVSQKSEFHATPLPRYTYLTDPVFGAHLAVFLTMCSPAATLMLTPRLVESRIS